MSTQPNTVFKADSGWWRVSPSGGGWTWRRVIAWHWQEKFFDLSAICAPEEDEYTEPLPARDGARFVYEPHRLLKGPGPDPNKRPGPVTGKCIEVDA